MISVRTVGEVFEAIQRAKVDASAFTTNFFPVQARLQSWINRSELLAEVRDGVASFLRKDRNFWHYYFAASNPSQLERYLGEIPQLKREPVVMDVVGREAVLPDLLRVLETSDFRRYARLVRLARPYTASLLSVQSTNPSPNPAPAVLLAESTDSHAILRLLESSFNPYADQLPEVYEIDEAISRKQILTVKIDGALAALLYFETQGVTSTVRYWAVAEQFRSLRLGSVLMRHYFSAQQAVRRFILWVTAANENALQKYQHYGYAPDGLVDHVLANPLIPS